MIVPIFSSHGQWTNQVHQWRSIRHLIISDMHDYHVPISMCLPAGRWVVRSIKFNIDQRNWWIVKLKQQKKMMESWIWRVIDFTIDCHLCLSGQFCLTISLLEIITQWNRQQEIVWLYCFIESLSSEIYYSFNVESTTDRWPDGVKIMTQIFR